MDGLDDGNGLRWIVRAGVVEGVKFSVVDRLNPKLLESSEVVPHRLEHVGRVALPIRVLGDDP